MTILTTTRSCYSRLLVCIDFFIEDVRVLPGVPVKIYLFGC